MNPTNQMASNPLDHLPPPILPSSIDAWPPAIGWWLLVLLVFLGVSTLSYFFWVWRRATALKREASSQLTTCYQQYTIDHNEHQYLINANQLLRRFCLQQYPELNCAKLSGQAWVEFLDERSSPIQKESGQLEKLLRIYQATQHKNIDIKSLHYYLTAWFKSVNVKQKLKKNYGQL